MDEVIPDFQCFINSNLSVTVGDTLQHVLKSEDTRLPYDLLYDSPRPVYIVDDCVWCRLVQSQDIFIGAYLYSQRANSDIPNFLFH